MPAIEGGPGASPQIGDGIIRGYIVSTEGGGAGSMVKRYGHRNSAPGTAEMDTVVEGLCGDPARSPKAWFGNPHLGPETNHLA